MGVTQSHLGTVSLQSEEDDVLIGLNEDIFDEAIIKPFLKTQRKREQYTEPTPDLLGNTFSFERKDAEEGWNVVGKADIQKLMQDIASLSDLDPNGMKYTRELETRQDVLSLIHEGIRRETVRVTKRTRDRITTLKGILEKKTPPMTLPGRVGLNLLTNVFLEFVRSYQGSTSDRRFLVANLSLVDRALQLPPLSFQDGEHFSPDLAVALQPLLDFLSELAANSEVEELRELVIQVMIHLAFVRGSVAEVLALVEVFQQRLAKGVDIPYKIGNFLTYLSEFQAQQEGVATKKFEKKFVTLQTYRGQYLNAADNGAIVLESDCKDSAVFAIHIHGSQVAFMDTKGNYLKATDDGNLNHSSARAGSAEKFTLIPAPEDSDYPEFVAIRTRRQTYLKQHESEAKVIQDAITEESSYFQIKIKEEQQKPEWDVEKKEEEVEVFPSNAEAVVKKYTEVTPKSRHHLDDGDGAPMKTSQAMLLLVAHLDRLASSQVVDKKSTTGGQLAVLWKPFSLNVTSRTFRLLSSILERPTQHYFIPATEKHGCDNDDEYQRSMSILLSCLRILKAHLIQIVLSNLPLRYFHIKHAQVIALKEQVFKFLKTPPAPRPKIQAVVDQVAKLVQAEAAELLADSFEFFFPNVGDQVTYLAELLNKRLHLAQEGKKERKESDEDDQVDSLGGAENALLELLLFRFTTFASGALLMDELEGKGNTKDILKSQEVVKSVFSLLLSVCSIESQSALETEQKRLRDKDQKEVKKKPQEKRSGVLLILQNLQKHLLSRAGQWRKLTDEEEIVTIKKNLASYDKEPWYVAFQTLADYSIQLIDNVLPFIQKVSKFLKEEQSTRELREVAHKLLGDSIAGQLLRPLICSLSLFPSIHWPELSIKLLPALTKLAHVLDSLIVIRESIPGYDSKVQIEK